MHCYHSYLIANLRLVLGVDVTPTDSLGFWKFWTILVRQDGLVMSAVEERGRLPVKAAYEEVGKGVGGKLSTESGWSDAMTQNRHAGTLLTVALAAAEGQWVLADKAYDVNWGGFTTQDLKRTQITARMTALVYNW